MANQMNFLNRSINADLWINRDENVPKNTPMREFYYGKTIFLTGGTGFLGQLFVEKLLRCEAKMLYLLARAKKGKSSSERIQNTFSGDLFSVLAKQNPNYMERIRIIEGDTHQLNAGISAEDQQIIIDNVDFIIHAAADVRFDVSLKELTLSNLRGTRELIKLAERVKNLQLFVYISTAYSQCHLRHIEERFYECPIDPNDMIRIAEKFNDADEKEQVLLDILSDSFIMPWPNTYTFSKALSEELIRRCGNQLPVIVIRPSIVISTHEDPIPGWCNNTYGLNGMLVGGCLGFLRIMSYKPEQKGEIVCADFVINSTLAAAWDRCSLMLGDRKAICAEEPKIYTVAARDDDIITWGRISLEMRDQLAEFPSAQSLWVATPSTTKWSFFEYIYMFLYHVFPGIIFDIFLKFTQSPKRLLPLYRKYHMFEVKLKYFMTQEWTFSKKNMYAVYDRMTNNDQKFFPCDLRKFDWFSFRINYHLGLMQYIGRETLDHFDVARKKFKKLQIAHLIAIAMYYVFFGFCYYFIGRCLGINNHLIYFYEIFKSGISKII